MIRDLVLKFSRISRYDLPIRQESCGEGIGGSFGR